MKSKYRLGIIELYWNRKHTKNEKLEGHFIMVTPVSLTNFKSKGFNLILNCHFNFINCYYFNIYKNHNLIRNYYKIYSNLNNYKISIIEIIKIDNFNVAIDKTFFLKIFQRKIKNKLKSQS
tara:strand:- start:138 stop:500 length:363 start_codon:yes stop_codon:yes gene_type:complete